MLHLFFIVFFSTLLLILQLALAQVHCSYEFGATLSFTTNSVTTFNVSSSDQRMGIASAPWITDFRMDLIPFSRRSRPPNDYGHLNAYLLPIDAYHPRTKSVIQRINSEYSHVFMYHVPGAEPPQIEPQIEVFDYVPQDLPTLPMTQFGGKSPFTSAPYNCPGLDPADEASLLLFKYGFIPHEAQKTQRWVYNIVIDVAAGNRIQGIMNNAHRVAAKLEYDRKLPNVTLQLGVELTWPDGWYPQTDSTYISQALTIAVVGGIVAGLVLCFCGYCCWRRYKKRRVERQIEVVTHMYTQRPIPNETLL
ncbi:hypothetical protein GQ42DRAFT_154769 [Ramicandelaber brevisporus]|nr:hypothetical protein GQ42DRAFT_154769 [Ramicandelaber brevisporus]